MNHPATYSSRSRTSAGGRYPPLRPPVISSRRATSSESDLQAAIVQHLKLRSKAKVFYCAIPNGEYRSKRTAARLKKQGVVAGAPDLFVLVDGTAYGLELKTEAGRASPAQKAVAQSWGDAGGFYYVAYGLDSALKFLEDIGAIEPERKVA